MTSTTRVNPLTASATSAETAAAKNALDSVANCPVCSVPMQLATSCGHPVRVCLTHRVCLPQENANV